MKNHTLWLWYDIRIMYSITGSHKGRISPCFSSTYMKHTFCQIRNFPSFLASSNLELSHVTQLCAEQCAQVSEQAIQCFSYVEPPSLSSSQPSFVPQSLNNNVFCKGLSLTRGQPITQSFLRHNKGYLFDEIKYQFIGFGRQPSVCCYPLMSFVDGFHRQLL